MSKTLLLTMAAATFVPVAIWATDGVTPDRSELFTTMVNITENESVDLDISHLTLSEKRYMPGHILASQVEPTYSAFKISSPRAENVKIEDYLGARNVMGHVYSSKSMLAGKTSVTKEDDTHVVFNGFFYTDVKVKAEIDASAGEFTIPAGQILVETAEIGKVALCPIDLSTGVYSATAPIKGTLVDGNYHIDQPYAFFVVDGPEKGKYLTAGIMEYSAIASANGSITNKFIGYGGDGTSTTANQQVVPLTRDVYAYPVGNDRLRLMMLPIHATSGVCSDIMINLGSDKKVEMDPQTVYNFSIYGDFNFYGMTEKTDASGKITYSATILSPVAVTYTAKGDGCTLEWGSWMAASTTTGVYSASKGATVTLDFPIVFPEKLPTTLEGEGTAENPYKISTAKDLAVLSYLTFNSRTHRGTLKTNPLDSEDKYYNVFEGKVFELVNDIDFSDLDMTFQPIGNKVYRFAAEFKGNNHKISNLNIKNYAYDYCGLFGGTGDKANLHDFTVVSPLITSLGYGIAGVSAYNAGVIDNVKVDGLNINAPKGYNNGGITAFNYGTIRNCDASAIYIYSMGYSGGITGRLVSGNIENCHADGRIIFIGSQAFGGGIAGYVTKLAVSSPGSKISDSSYSGTIQATNNEIGIGGIAGAFNFSEAERCFANVILSNASPQSAYVGGLGGSTGESKFTDCYVTGWVRNAETANCGGLAGHSNEYTNPVGTVFTNCYAAVMLDTKSANPYKGLAGDMTNFTFNNCHYDAQVASLSDDTYSLNTAEMTAAEGIRGFSSDVWTFEKGLYPRLKAQAESDASLVASSTVTLNAKDMLDNITENFTYQGAKDVEWNALVDGKLNSAGGYAFTFENGTGKLNFTQRTDTIYVKKGNLFKYYIANIAPVFFDGEGTAEQPWLIKSKEDYLNFARISVDATMPFKDRFFRLATDIDFGGDTIIAVCKDNAAKLAFAGTFDGDGHTLDNFVITHVGYDANGKYDPKSSLNSFYTGLFANLDKGGTVKNLTIGSKALIEGTSYVGAIAGGSIGTVENCSSYATVKCVTNYAGGIVGYVKKDTDKAAPAKGKVRGCYNAGKVSANYNSAAGIVGFAVEAIVENCENTGEISAYNFNASQKEGVQNTAGGIVGQVTSSTITNVVNSGTISSYKTVGGIVGNFAGTAVLPSKVTNAVNYGRVIAWTEPFDLGQIVGKNNLGTFENCYADRQIETAGMVANGSYEGVKAVSSAELTGGKLPLPEDAWAQRAGTYPTMKYSKVPEQVALNSKAVVIFAEKESADAFLSTATLSGNVNWTIEDGGDSYSISDSLLKVVLGKEKTEAVLVAKTGDLRRELPLSSFDIFILEGKGTAEAPFLINNAADFNTLAEFVNSTDFDYSGYKFKVTADLDFKDMKFVPVGDLGASFNGEFDGNGKKFSNISYSATEKTDKNKAVFCIVGSYGTVKNMELASTCSITAYTFAGGIAGALYGRIEKCVSEAAVTTTGATNAAGIAAIAYAGASISECVNKGAITSKSTLAGGILGSSAANARIEISKCENSGKVSGTSKIGGIAGSASAFITESSNSGEVKATSSYAGGVIAEALLPSGLTNVSNSGKVSTPQYLGGVIATSAIHTDAQRLSITGCVNTADIEVGTKGYAGGIGGSLKAGVKLIDCHNSGNILAPATTTAIRVGGISGDLTSTKAGKTTLDSCYNMGDIRSATLAAGIAGYFSNAQDDKAYMRNCYNTGNITGVGTAAATNVGGLLGNGGSVIIEDCWNSGDVTSAGGYVGGLVGQKNSHITSFSRNFNTGTVTGGNAGVGGLIGYGRAGLYDCANYGDVTGTKQVGGIMGLSGPVAAAIYTLEFHDAYNAGKVTATADPALAGNIAVIGTSTKYFNASNLYFNSDVNGSLAGDAKLKTKDGKAAVTGLGTAELCKLDLSKSFLNLEATYPVIASHHGNVHHAFAVSQLLLAENDEMNNVTAPFIVGTPDGAVWTATDNLRIEDGVVTPLNKTKGEKATITLTAGEKKRVYELTLNADNSAIGDIDIDGKEIKSTDYYTTDGRLISNPEPGMIVIERVVYTDGTTTVNKVRVR